MSNAVANRPANGASVPATSADDAMAISYIPFGERSEIKLTPSIIRKFLARPTKSGKMPDDATVVKFMMLCKARELNPFAGDAFMVGYDGSDGAEFSCITAHQALLKRAEACPAYNGMQSGVIVRAKDASEPINREGDFIHEGDILLGAWAIVYRKDRDFPSTDRLNVTTFDKGISQWKKDRAGMIVKCAEASALRKAFPTQLGALYTSDEYERFGDVTMVLDGTPRVSAVPQQSINQLADMRKAKAEQSQAPQPAITQDPPQIDDAEVTLMAVFGLIDAASTGAELDDLRARFVGPDATEGVFTAGEWTEIDKLIAERRGQLNKKPAKGQQTLMDTGNPSPD